MAEKTEKDDATARLNGRMALLAQGLRVLQATGKVSIVGVRGFLPVLELYSGVSAAAIDDEQGAEEGADTGKAADKGLRRGETAVLRAAGTRAVLELMEVTSVTHPVYEGAPRYIAFTENNIRQTPHLVHFLALAAALKAYFGEDDGDQPPQEPEVLIDPQQTVAYVAVAPGEYALTSDPLQPRQIRRHAMRQRNQSQPQLAMLASSSDPTSIVAAPLMTNRKALRATQRAGAPVTGYRHHKGCSCGCGDGGLYTTPCGCGCGPRTTRSFPPARYDDDGSCASVFDVSCDTRWRIRECFKVALCDMLRCVSEEMCEDGRLVDEPDLGRCVDGFVCSLLECLPDAICPPPAKKTCCVDEPASHDHCNFAVGE